MVVAEDYRFLLAEDAINRVENRAKSWNLPYPLNKGVALEIARRVRSLLMKLRYMYLPYTMIIDSDELKQLESYAGELSRHLLPPKNVRIEGSGAKLAVAEIRYALSILLGLRARLALGDENIPEHAVDVIGVEVGFVERHPRADKLWITKVGTEHFSFTVVTNIQNVKRGETRGVAVLPPTLFFDVVSEAMFCSDPLDRSYRSKRIPSSLIHRAELINAIEAIIESLR